MERYQRVEKAKAEVPISDNEIRITSQGLVRNYISYSSSLLQERRVPEIVLKAMGQAISKTVAIAEIIKKRMPRLHQDTAISSVSITDVWEPIEEGLVPVEMTRHVSMVSITLSFRELNENSPGYQAPLHGDQAKPQYRYQQQPRQARASYANEDAYAQGRGRGRGRGWGRGGYGNYQDRNYHGGGNQGGNYGGGGNYQGGGNFQGGGNYRGRGNYLGGGNYRGGGNYQGRGNYRGRGNYQGGGNYHGEGNYQGGGYHEDEGNYQDNGGYSNYGRGGGQGRGWNYRGMGYERGRVAGGRVYNQGRWRMGGRSRGGANNSNNQP
ncbi:hypothetical protein MLD38_012392 [Melastoma candidum]|uniref:Uncharacterized protein n=1 Tax=Melastoma candidum TaxID=119954 RepID=A0ACB9R6S1_9MYRT|nr:hypothetical protein MLD38_012392 [Melastoma candidum]